MGTKKQKKRSLRLTLLLLLLAAILLLTSSYAWFTANQTVTISQLEVNVAAQNGLQISANGKDWSALINKDDLSVAATTYTTLTNQFPANLAPVSTAGNITEGKMDMFLGAVNADKSTGKDMLTATKETETTGTTGNFIAFDMFLRVEQATNIELTANSNVKAVGTSKGIENASRVAFVVQGTQPAGTELATIQGMNEATTSTRYIWEPNFDVHTKAAVSHASSVYGITTKETGAEQIPYDGIQAVIETPVAVATNASTNSTAFAATTVAYRTPANFGVIPDGETESTDKLSIFQLSAGITKIRVYMWIEGQDVDCENSASGTNIAFNIQISKSAEQPGTGA